MKVIYQPEQVRRSAKFLKKRNPAFSGRTALEIEQSIMVVLRDHVRSVKKCIAEDSDWHYTFTGGYLIMAFLADDDVIEIDVLVDAAVGRETDCKRLEK